MVWNWYGVKSLFRYAAKGKAKSPDKFYDPNATMVEERVVVLRARTFDEALKKGEAEARAYAAGPGHRNPYGQLVRMRYMGGLDAFQLFGPPGRGAEVFSSTTIVPKRLADAKVLDIRLGRANEHRGRRTQFLNAALSSKDWWRAG
jgi:hypothetical protein